MIYPPILFIKDDLAFFKYPEVRCHVSYGQGKEEVT